MVKMRGSAINGVIKQSTYSLPPPHISNKEIIWKLTGRERSPEKELTRDQSRMKICQNNIIYFLLLIVKRDNFLDLL